MQVDIEHQITWLYFDLEGTIIDVFDAGNHMNIDRAKSLIATFGVSDIGIFSFAIYDQADKDHFYRNIAPGLEDALGVRIIVAPSVKEQQIAHEEHTGHKYDSIHDWIRMVGKVQGFQSWAYSKLGNCELAILVDDVVPNLDMIYNDINFSISYINIDRYKIST